MGAAESVVGASLIEGASDLLGLLLTLGAPLGALD